MIKSEVVPVGKNSNGDTESCKDYMNSAAFII